MTGWHGRIARGLSRWLPYRTFDGSVATPLFVKGQLRGSTVKGCPALHRWTLLHRKGLKVYLHCWEGDDWSTDFHDHSARMLSIWLWGAYADVTPAGATTYRAPFVRTFPATHAHRIVVLTRPAWTLVFTGRQTQHSAFLVDGTRIGPATYLTSPRAKTHRAC